VQVVCGFGLGDPTTPYIRKGFHQEDSRREAHDAGNQKQSQRRGVETKQDSRGRIDGDREEHGRQCRNDGDNDGQSEKEMVLTHAKLRGT
jgi:hypothetical protein